MVVGRGRGRGESAAAATTPRLGLHAEAVKRHLRSRVARHSEARRVQLGMDASPARASGEKLAFTQRT